MTSPALIRPITPNDHPPLRTLEDVCAYVVSLPSMRRWDTAANLMAEMGNAPSEAALDELTQQVEIALVLDRGLDPAGFAVQSAALLGRIGAQNRDFPTGADQLRLTGGRNELDQE